MWFHQEKGEHRVRGGGARYLLRWVVEQKVGEDSQRKDDLTVQSFLLFESTPPLCPEGCLVIPCIW